VGKKREITESVQKKWRQLKGDYMFLFLNAEGNRKCSKKEETMESVGKKREATECV